MTGQHRLWFGPFSQLRQRLSQRLQSLRKHAAFEPVEVIVPSNLAGIDLRRSMAEEQPLFNVRFLTLIDLARRVAPSDAGSRRVVSSLGRLIVTQEVIREFRGGSADSRKDTDETLDPLLQRESFDTALYRTFCDLDRAGCSAGTLAAVGRDVENSEWFKLLPELYRCYRQHLSQRGWITGSDLFRTAAEAIEQGNASSLRGFRADEASLPLFVYGFHELNEVQRRLLAACTSGRPFEVFHPLDRVRSESYAFARPHFDWWCGLGCEPAAAGPAGSPDQQFASRSLDGFEVVSAAGEAQEVKAAARQILAAAERGTPFQRMAVLSHRLDDYRLLIEETFERADIPYFMPRGRRLAETKTGRAALRLLGLMGRQPKRAELIDWLTESPLKKTWLPPDGETGWWDQISIDSGVVQGWYSWDSAWQRLEDRYDGQPRLQGALESLKRLIDHLAADLGDTAAMVSWDQGLERLIDLIQSCLQPVSDREWLLESLSDLQTMVEAKAPVPWDSFRRVVRECIERQAEATGSFQRQAVSVLPASAARGLSFDLSMVLGMEEGAFPVQPRQDPLLPDRYRQRMNHRLNDTVPADAGPAAVDPLPLKRQRSGEERLLFECICESAERLVLSYARFDRSNGRERLPSHFILEEAAERHGELLSYDDLIVQPCYRRLSLNQWAPLDVPQSLNPAEWRLAQVLRAYRQGENERLAEVIGCFQADQPQLKRALQAESLRWGEKELTAYDGMIEQNELQAFLRRSRGSIWGNLSATRLETYATCPFRYFLRYVLELEPVEEPESIWQLSALDRGTVVHHILERFYNAARREHSEGRPLSASRLEAYEQMLEDEAESVFEQAEKKLPTGYEMTWELACRSMVDELKGYLSRAVKRDSRWIPVALESQFDGQTAVLALPGGGRAGFHGRMDRVDRHVTSERARVVDYKTGRLKYFKDDDLQGGETIQLAVYLLAASQHLGLPPERLVAEYHSVSRRGGYERVRLSGQHWEQHETDLMAMTQTAAEGIENGRFFQVPNGGDNCRYCDFSSVCPGRVDELAERKRDDPRTRSFRALKDESS